MLNPDLKNLEIVIDSVSEMLSEVKVSAVETQILRKGDRFVFLPGSNLMQGSNVLELMRHAPFITVDDKSEEFSIINKSSTTIYINNVKSQVPPQMLLQMLKSLPANDIKSIEIITNPGSEYKANTTGGIININLKRQLYEGWLGNLTLQSSQANYNTTILNGSVNYRKDKLALQFIPFFNRSFNYHTENDLFAYAGGNNQQDFISHFRRYFVAGGGVNADYTVNPQSYISMKIWRTNVNGNTKQQEKTNYSKAGSSSLDSTVSAPYQGNDFYSYTFGNLNYHINLNKAGDSHIDFNLDYSHYYRRQNISGSFIQSESQGDITKNEGNYSNILPQDFTNLSGSVDFGKQFKNNLNLSAGLQYSTTQVNSNLTYFNINNGISILNDSLSKNYLYNEKYAALYISMNKSFSKKVYASLGLRLENTNYNSSIQNTSTKIDSTYLNFFPSFSFSYVPNTNNQFSYSLSRKILRPNIESLFPGRIYNGPDVYTENNPFLLPSYYINNELTYFINQKYSIDINYYVMKNSFAQFVVPIIESQNNVIKTTYLNYGSANNLSIVFYFNQTLIKNVWDISVTPYANLGSFTGTVESTKLNVTNTNFNLIYDNVFNLSTKNAWTAFLTFKYFGKKEDIAGNTLNATSLLELELKKTFKNLSFYLILSDLYNGTSVVKQEHFTNFLLAENYSEINNYNRSISLRIRYNFGNNAVKGNKNRNSANEDIRKRSN